MKSLMVEMGAKAAAAAKQAVRAARPSVTSGKDPERWQVHGGQEFGQPAAGGSGGLCWAIPVSLPGGADARDAHAELQGRQGRQGDCSTTPPLRQQRSALPQESWERFSLMQKAVAKGASGRAIGKAWM